MPAIGMPAAEFGMGGVRRRLTSLTREWGLSCGICGELRGRRSPRHGRLAAGARMGTRRVVGQSSEAAVVRPIGGRWSDEGARGGNNANEERGLVEQSGDRRLIGGDVGAGEVLNIIGALVGRCGSTDRGAAD
jgi:hypothetical protein